jgi:hypothetical protein
MEVRPARPHPNPAVELDRARAPRTGCRRSGCRADRNARAGTRRKQGGFYWHFDDRGALLGEILDTWERVVSDDVIVIVEREGGDARDKLRQLFAVATSIDDMVKVEIAIREWARRDKAVAKRLRPVDNRRMD